MKRTTSTPAVPVFGFPIDRQQLAGLAGKPCDGFAGIGDDHKVLIGQATRQPFDAGVSLMYQRTLSQPIERRRRQIRYLATRVTHLGPRIR